MISPHARTLQQSSAPVPSSHNSAEHIGADLSQLTVPTLTADISQQGLSRELPSGKSERAGQPSSEISKTLSRVASDRELPLDHKMERIAAIWEYESPSFSTTDRFVALDKIARLFKGTRASQQALSCSTSIAKSLCEPITSESGQTPQTRLSSVSARDLSRCAWSLATTRCRVDSTLDEIADRFTALSASSSPQDIANTLWAFGKLGKLVPVLFDTCAEVAMQKLDKFKPQELSNMLWSFATTGHRHQPLFEAAAKHITGE